MSIAILPWIFLVLVLFMLVMPVLAFLRRRRRPLVERPSCGSCKYPVEGLPTFICPECGSDLRHVGIVTPQTMQREMPRAMIGVLWTIALLVMGGVISALLAPVVPDVKTTRSTRTYVLSCFDEQARRNEDRATLSLAAHRREYRDDLSGTLKVTLSGSQGDVADVEIDLQSQTWTSDWEQTGSGVVDQLDAAFMERWLQEAGVELEESEMRRAAIGLKVIVLASVRGVEPTDAHEGRWYGRGGSSSGRVEPHPAWSAGAGIFWLVVWIVGLVILVRKGRSGGGATALS